MMRHGAQATWECLYIIKTDQHGWRQHKAPYVLMVSAQKQAFLVKQLETPAPGQSAQLAEHWSRLAGGSCRVLAVGAKKLKIVYSGGPHAPEERMFVVSLSGSGERGAVLEGLRGIGAQLLQLAPSHPVPGGGGTGAGGYSLSQELTDEGDLPAMSQSACLPPPVPPPALVYRLSGTPEGGAPPPPLPGHHHALPATTPTRLQGAGGAVPFSPSAPGSGGHAGQLHSVAGQGWGGAHGPAAPVQLHPLPAPSPGAALRQSPRALLPAVQRPAQAGGIPAAASLHARGAPPSQHLDTGPSTLPLDTGSFHGLEDEGGGVTRPGRGLAPQQLRHGGGSGTSSMAVEAEVVVPQAAAVPVAPLLPIALSEGDLARLAALLRPALFGREYSAGGGAHDAEDMDVDGAPVKPSAVSDGAPVKPSAVSDSAPVKPSAVSDGAPVKLSAVSGPRGRAGTGSKRKTRTGEGEGQEEEDGHGPAAAAAAPMTSEPARPPSTAQAAGALADRTLHRSQAARHTPHGAGDDSPPPSTSAAVRSAVRQVSSGEVCYGPFDAWTASLAASLAACPPGSSDEDAVLVAFMGGGREGQADAILTRVAAWAERRHAGGDTSGAPAAPPQVERRVTRGRRSS